MKAIRKKNQKGARRKKSSDFDSLVESISSLAGSLMAVYRQSYNVLLPIVDDICQRKENVTQNELDHCFDYLLNILQKCTINAQNAQSNVNGVVNGAAIAENRRNKTGNGGFRDGINEGIMGHDAANEGLNDGINLYPLVECLMQRRREAEGAEKSQKSEVKERYDKKRPGNFFHPIGENNYDTN